MVKNCSNCTHSTNTCGMICVITEDPVEYTDVCKLHTLKEGGNNDK